MKIAVLAIQENNDFINRCDLFSDIVSAMAKEVNDLGLIIFPGGFFCGNRKKFINYLTNNFSGIATIIGWDEKAGDKNKHMNNGSREIWAVSKRGKIVATIPEAWIGSRKKDNKIYNEIIERR